MNDLVEKLWDALRDVACSTKRNAHCIVLLNKNDVKKAVQLLTEPKNSEKTNDNSRIQN